MRLQCPSRQETPRLAHKVAATPTIATPSRDVIIRLAELNVAKHFKFMPPRYPFLHPCPPMGGQVESKIPSQLDLHDADFLCVKKTCNDDILKTTK